MKSLPRSNRKTAFLFPGSGAQHLGMGRALRNAFPDIENELREINSTLGCDLASAMDGPPELLFPPVDSPTPTIFMEVTMALSLAVARSLARAVAFPDVIAGRSMGEYSAASFSGVFGTKECFLMVRTATLYGQEDCLENPSSLVTIYGLSRLELGKVAEEMSAAGHLCEVVAFYDKPRIGAAGLRNPSLEELRKRLAPFRHRISVSKEVGAFHSTLFDRLAGRARGFFSGIPFSPPARPLYMNLDAAPEVSPSGIKEKLASALNSPVLWQETIRNMLAADVRTFVEMAPGAMLTEFICELPPDAEVLRTDTPEHYNQTVRRLAEKPRA